MTERNIMIRIWKLAACVSLFALALSQASAANLKVGLAAPPLKVAKWIKGTPVTTFEPGKVYVVEFWATWCGPCKQSIPHLTELAKKYAGKVNFTGVSVWEDKDSAKTGSSAYMTKVATFVKTMGDNMAYNVAVDDPKGTMSETWMHAAEQNGIPTAFVIDQKGKIAWIGHPMIGLDKVLPQVVAGKFDASAAAREREEAEAEAKQAREGYQRAMAAVGTGKVDEGFKLLDEVASRFPKYRMGVAITKFQVLTQKDEPAAYKLARKMGENELKDDPFALNNIAWTIVEGKGLKNPDYAVACSLAQRAVEVSKSQDAAIMDTYGFALFKCGKVDEAITVQEKAVALANADKNVPADMKKEITDRLADFKKAKK